MNIKRCCAFLMAAVMGLSLTACGGGNGVHEETESGAVELKIGVNGAPEFDPEPEPESLPTYAALFGGDTSDAQSPDTPDAGTSDAPISGEIVKAVYPEAVPYPREEAYYRDGVGFDSEAYFAAYEKWSDADRARPDLTPEELAPLSAFFRDGTREFLKGDANRAYSPVNVYMALAMLSGLTAGNSQKQILSLLGAESPDALASQANRVWNALYNDDGTSTTLLGSSLWLNENVHFNAETLKKLSETFYASSYAGKMGSAEFDNALQTWLNQQTRGLLSEQAGGVKMSENTLLALATTIYFKSNWRDEFNASRTAPDVFHAVDGDRNAPFMRQTFTGTYYKGDGFSAVRKAMQSGEMWLILPDTGKTPADLLGGGAAMDFIANPENYVNIGRADIVLSLPKFDVSADFSLIDGLMSLGVTDVFDSGVSDFTPMTTDTEEIAIGQAKHAARVKIDEEGCEAAAFTVMMAGATAAMEAPPRVEFTLDRPFAFAVTGQENLPLFVGAVQTPLNA